MVSRPRAAAYDRKVEGLQVVDAAKPLDALLVGRMAPQGLKQGMAMELKSGFDFAIGLLTLRLPRYAASGAQTSITAQKLSLVLETWNSRRST